MLTELCQELRNWFEKDKHFGTFTISGGQLTNCPYLQDGQYFRIVGSIFNDGVHQWPSDDLIDESFKGAIWAMAVPPAVVALCDDIEAWEAKYGGVDGVLMSPYSSESFGGYSYTKASGSSDSRGSRGSTSLTWQSAFASRLNNWRKI